MVNRITSVFANRRKSSLLIPFLTAGDPDVALSLKLLDDTLAAGADMVEIGIPYSDPLADGPVIQAASLRSLQAGFSLPICFELTAELHRKHPQKPLILFTYVNPVLQYRPDRFFSEAAASGADGVIIPDLPMEESGPFRTLAERNNLALIPLVTPVTSEQRMQAICQSATGFIYAVAALGVTGMRSQISDRVEQMVHNVRKYSNLPVAVGFGVSSPAQAKVLSTYADGVIVGSAVIRKIEDALLLAATDSASDRDDTVRTEVRHFIESLNKALQSDEALREQ